MIPLHKLGKLPRSQRLRKAAKILGEAEARFMVSGRMRTEEAEYLVVLMDMLAADDRFSPAAIAALRSARVCFEAVQASVSYIDMSCIDMSCTDISYSNGSDDIRRALNKSHNLIMAETGCFKSDWDFLESDGALDPSKRHPFLGMRVYLEDIRSPFNVGAMFRAAESFGVEKIWLSPLCADPRHKRAERTAMGCVSLLPWERFNLDPFSFNSFSELKETDASGSLFPIGPIFAMETGGIPLGDFPFPSGGVLIAGSEELGVSPQALAAADASLGRVSIPTYGAKGSLNVSVAFGIVMQAWASSYKK